MYKCKRCGSKYISKYKKCPACRKESDIILNKYIFDLKLKSCVHCGNSYHPASMQFDHLSNKTFSISDKNRLGKNIEDILNEVKKCNLVCGY